MATARVVDLRSDTVTRPSAAMRAAMAEAEVGDDVYGEDPTVQKLEARTATRLGLAAGLFVPSGHMGNQVAIGAHCSLGDELIVDEGSHCVVWEGGAVSALWGVQPRTLVTPRGIFTPEQLSAAVRSDNIHYPRSRLVVVENTHNRGGGAVWPLEQFRAVVARARQHGLRVHLDGARLFNAEVASGHPAAEFAGLTDSTTVCFSKGLGAPVGSVLCGSAELVSGARRLRKRLGGGMRQVGILAAAALHALEHNVERLAQDHENARVLAAGLARLPGVEVDLKGVETNLVYAKVSKDAEAVVKALAAEGVLSNATGPRSLRFATHLDVSSADIEHALEVVRHCV